MPTWDGIEDASPKPTTIWLSREKETDPWSPLRKVDCRALNDRPGECVKVESGRATADPNNNVIRYNFYNSPSRKLISATWFTKDEQQKTKEGKVTLIPMSIGDATKVEELYQKAVSATTSLGSGIDSVLKEEILLDDDINFKVIVQKSSSGNLSMKKRGTAGITNVFGPIFDLQRGYGEYVVEGEEEELALGPVKHLIFVIHGVGEAMWSRDDVNVISMIQEIDRARKAMQRVQIGEWKKRCEKAEKMKQPIPPPPNRIELLPIEWYDRIHSSSNALMKSLKATTLRTIPALRDIANDVVFDVMMYLTPEFCDLVLGCVITQINDLFLGFQLVHKGFVMEGGKCSLIGHSLGSVIVWDMLSILKYEEEEKERMRSQQMGSGTEDDPIVPTTDDDTNFIPNAGVYFRSSTGPSSVPLGYQAYATTDDHLIEAKRSGTWGPSILKRMSQTLPFRPDFTIFLGSPLGLFLTLRGAHAVFDDLRIQSDLLEEDALAKKPSAPSSDVVTTTTAATTAAESTPPSPPSSPFTLPSNAIYNIFHPNDPVAYRIEPLLLPPDTCDTDNNIPPPEYLVKEGQGVRFHVKAMQFGDNVKKAFTERSASINSFFSTIAENAAAAMQSNKGDEEAKAKSPTKPMKLGPHKFALGGRSSRVDFQLQTGVIDNQYLSAVSAHSNYFTNTDVMDFVIDICAASASSADAATTTTATAPASK